MIASPFYPFVMDNLDHAPNGPSVYGLYVRDGRIHRAIFIGGSLTSVRTSLHRHLLGNGQACTRDATHFTTEATDVEYVVSRQAAILTAIARRRKRFRCAAIRNMCARSRSREPARKRNRSET